MVNTARARLRASRRQIRNPKHEIRNNSEKEKKRNEIDESKSKAQNAGRPAIVILTERQRPKDLGDQVVRDRKPPPPEIPQVANAPIGMTALWNFVLHPFAFRSHASDLRFRISAQRRLDSDFGFRVFPGSSTGVIAPPY
jgi:hypothetical protein